MPAQQQSANGKGGDDEAGAGDNYYAAGSTDQAKPTALTLRKLEKRRKLTANSDRLVIALVGLPGRGKSFVARKLMIYLTWRGTECRVFNVGKYRREAHANLMRRRSGGGEGGEVGGNGDAGAERKREDVGACDADFFDSKNEAAARLREEVAALAMADMLAWLDREEDGAVCSASASANGSPPRGGASTSRRVLKERVTIFDATNSTDARRKWILEECTGPRRPQGRPTGVVFVESICDDEELLDENFRYKARNSPDYRGMTEEDAIADLRRRVRKYEEQYETITDDSLSYIKIFNLSSKLMVNHIYGRMAKIIVPSLMSWNIGSRPIYITRAGETMSLAHRLHPPGATAEAEASASASTSSPPEGRPRSSSMPAYLAHAAHAAPSPSSGGSMIRGGRLAPMGVRFRDALCEFIRSEGREFIAHQANAERDLNTGTSINGLRRRCSSWTHLADLANLADLHEEEEEEEEEEEAEKGEEEEGRRVHEEGEYLDEEGRFPFPCLVMSSTMPRAVETATWDRLPYPVQELSNLNPLDKGDFTGHELEEISKAAPDWYACLESDPFHTRFPGGECYGDLIHRLEPALIDMEQQVGLVVVVSHVSVIQTLVAYFRSTPVHECTSIEVPLHTVIKFTPSRGGGWIEERFPLLPDDGADGMDDTASTGRTSSEDGDGEGGALLAGEGSPIPIWGDHRRPPSRINSFAKEVEVKEELAPPSS